MGNRQPRRDSRTNRAIEKEIQRLLLGYHPGEEILAGIRKYPPEAQLRMLVLMRTVAKLRAATRPPPDEDRLQ